MGTKFYTEDGHLNDLGVALVIDALHRKEESLLPKGYIGAFKRM